MTFAELKTEVLRRAGESPTAPRFHTAAEAGAAINAAQRVFALLSLCLEDTAIIPVTAGNLITAASSVAPGWIAPLRLELDGAKLRPGTLAEFSALNPAWLDPTVTGTPTRYTMVGWDGIVLFASPAANLNISARFASAPTTITVDATSPQIPEEDHPALLGYAQFRLALKEGAEPMQSATAELRDFLAVARRRMQIVRSRSASLSYDTHPTEHWATILENPQWPLMLQA